MSAYNQTCPRTIMGTTLVHVHKMGCNKIVLQIYINSSTQTHKQYVVTTTTDLIVNNSFYEKSMIKHV